MDENKKINEKIKIAYADISSLKPAKYNPRRWTEIATEKLTESIKVHGLIDPLIINKAKGREGIIIGGNFRYEIAKKLGVKTVPVVYLKIEDLKVEKEICLRLNRNTGEWDYDLLKSFDIDLLLDIGFDDSDLSSIWDEALSAEDDEFNTQEELSKIKKIKTKPSDIYKLGPHILGCGNSLDFNFLDRLIGNSQIDMVYMDPPFNISLDYNRGIGGKASYGGKLTSDNKTDAEYRNFLTKAIENALRKVKSDAHIFTYCDESYIGLLQQIYTQLGIENKRVCLWIKNGMGLTPQIAFNKAYEACVYGTVGNPYIQDKLNNLTEVLNKEVDTGNRMLDDIYDIFDIWLARRLPAQQYEHPTEKPPTLHEKPLRRCTKISNTVLDLFGGSGSTLIACEQLKRKCVMTEIEPIFCDLIIKRYENLTAKEAIHVN